MAEELYNSHDYCLLAEELEALKVDYVISNRELLIKQAEIQRLVTELALWKADAEMLAKSFVIEVYPHEWVCRSGCHHMGKTPDTIEHAPDCPITLHRELVAKYGGARSILY